MCCRGSSVAKAHKFLNFEKVKSKYIKEFKVENEFFHIEKKKVSNSMDTRRNSILKKNQRINKINKRKDKIILTSRKRLKRDNIQPRTNL